MSRYGIDHTIVTKYRWTADTPRSHITNQRTVEILRNEGLEGEVKRYGTPQELMGDTVFCTSLAGEEFARLHTWGAHPRRLADYTLASPSIFYDLPQNYLEPILLGAAAARGTRVRFNNEYLSSSQDGEGVSARIRDRMSGEEFEIRARYPIGADDGRGKVAADAGLPTQGAMDLAGSMNIIFKADLSPYVAHRPSVLYWILQPGSAIGGIGLGLCRMVRPWDEWLIVWGYDIEAGPPELSEAEATQIARNLIGDPEIPLEITSTSLWTNNKMWATRYSQGRIHCMGDACHRHPPSNGLGSNTSIGDAYNLAWKLALVLEGKAEPALLDSYDAERAPNRRADRQARQPLDRGVRPDRAGPAREGRLDRGDQGQHGGPQGGDARRRRPAPQAAGGDRAEELRVQRPRGRDEPPLPLRRDPRRRQPRAALRARPRALLPPDHLARGARSGTIRRRSSAPRWTRS